jgi:hemerythrin-like domain-containing protein
MVLAALEQQSELLAEGRPVDFTLLECVFTYLLGYPAECHHPKEDAICRRLRRDAAMAVALDDVIDGHEALERKARTLRQSIAGTRTAARDAELAGQLADFVQAYRNHLAMEEQDLFPAAAQILTADDWAEIDFAVFDQADPLFDNEAEARYAGLRNEIKRLALASQAPMAGLDEAATLATLEDVAAFNAAMQEIGERLTLTRSDLGGYRLQREGHTLVHIPDCSESRAAWCAWFFWKAMAYGRGRGQSSPRARSGRPSVDETAQPTLFPV